MRPARPSDRHPRDVRPCLERSVAADDGGVPTDLSAMGWLVLVALLSGGAALIGRLAARLFLRASGSIARRRV